MPVCMCVRERERGGGVAGGGVAEGGVTVHELRIVYCVRVQEKREQTEK